MIQQNFSPGVLVRFLLYPLIFTMDYAYKGVVVGIGILVVYPFLSMIVDLLRRKIPMTDAVYMTSFCGVFLGTLYVLMVGSVDWGLYKALAFVFPASMTASAMLIGWLEDDTNNKEATPFIEAFTAAILVLIFSCIRDFLLHQSLNFRFGEFGVIYDFGGEVIFQKFAQTISQYNFWLPAIQLKAVLFFFIATLIGLMGISSSNQYKDKE